MLLYLICVKPYKQNETEHNRNKHSLTCLDIETKTSRHSYEKLFSKLSEDIAYRSKQILVEAQVAARK